MTTHATISPVLHYLVREPKVKSAHAPALLLLHGVGSNEKDLFSFADRMPDHFLVISARAPIVLGTSNFAWYQVDFSQGKPVFNFEQEEASRKTIIQFIGQLKEIYSIDEKQIYLCGFSQGAIMSYSVLLTRPDLVKGIAALSGRLLEEIKPLAASKENLTDKKIFIAHGIHDGTLPVHYAREAQTYLEKLNMAPTYKEYPTGHGITIEILNDFVSWLNKN